MSTLTKTPKQRKPRILQPVHGYAKWVGSIPTLEQLERGEAMLMIVADGKEPQIYLVKSWKDEDGNPIGFRLAKTGIEGETATPYDIDIHGETWRCDCPDAEFNSDRPGGCKHSKALRAAIAVCGK